MTEGQHEVFCSLVITMCYSAKTQHHAGLVVPQKTTQKRCAATESIALAKCLTHTAPTALTIGVDVRNEQAT